MAGSISRFYGGINCFSFSAARSIPGASWHGNCLYSGMLAILAQLPVFCQDSDTVCQVFDMACQNSDRVCGGIRSIEWFYGRIN